MGGLRHTRDSAHIEEQSAFNQRVDSQGVPERSSGTFERVSKLPAEVKADEVKATFRHGVLVVTLPKKEEAVPKSIEVKISE